MNALLRANGSGRVNAEVSPPRERCCMRKLLVRGAGPARFVPWMSRNASGNGDRVATWRLGIAKIAKRLISVASGPTTSPLHQAKVTPLRRFRLGAPQHDWPC